MTKRQKKPFFPVCFLSGTAVHVSGVVPVYPRRLLRIRHKKMERYNRKRCEQRVATPTGASGLNRPNKNNLCSQATLHSSDAGTITIMSFAFRTLKLSGNPGHSCGSTDHLVRA